MGLIQHFICHFLSPGCSWSPPVCRSQPTCWRQLNQKVSLTTCDKATLPLSTKIKDHRPKQGPYSKETKVSETAEECRETHQKHQLYYCSFSWTSAPTENFVTEPDDPATCSGTVTCCTSVEEKDIKRERSAVHHKEAQRCFFWLLTADYWFKTAETSCVPLLNKCLKNMHLLTTNLTCFLCRFLSFYLIIKTVL